MPDRCENDVGISCCDEDRACSHSASIPNRIVAMRMDIESTAESKGLDADSADETWISHQNEYVG